MAISYQLPLVRDTDFEILILDNAASVAKFVSKVEKYIDPRDFFEIYTQIIVVLLNDKALGQMNLLPDINRMRPHPSLQDAKSVEILRIATYELGVSVYNELVNIGAYQNGQLPYFFEKIIDGCFALYRLKY